MSNIEYLIGNESIDDSPLISFDNEVLDFLQKLSVTLMSNKSVRDYPDIAAFAYFCRLSNIKREQKKYANDFRMGRGLCFHIAPSNIPLNFAFSYVMSLVAGNANIVRLPSRDFPQSEIVVSIIKESLKNYHLIAKRTAFVKYDRESEWTDYFSKQADARMIWGGDNTVQKLKQIITKPTCIDVTFPNRYSVAIINGHEILRASSNTLNKLAKDFYNDTYLMDQNACSSPQIIFWINDCKEARTIFWERVNSYVIKKYELNESVSVDKYLSLCRNTINNSNINRLSKFNNNIYLFDISTIDDSTFTTRFKSGMFYEKTIFDYKELNVLQDPMVQTISHFGCDEEKIIYTINYFHMKGINRVTKIGNALEMNFNWDGFNIISVLSRNIFMEKNM